MSEFILNVSLRSNDEQGKGASRRLRKENLIPAIVYGGNGEPLSISVKKNELVKALESEAFFASLITLNVGDSTQEVIIKALQRHPAKGYPMHVDFQRIVRGQEMHFTVPVHFVGESVGVKAGGILSHSLNEIEISCLPRQLPEFIEVDVSAMQIGDVKHLHDVVLPAGITLVDHGNDQTIVTILAPKVSGETAAE